MEFKNQVIDYLDKVISLNINLVDYANKNNISIYSNGNLNKGWKGNVVEHLLNIPQNSKKGSDYIDLEIKTVPIIKKNECVKIKETTCLSVIDINSLMKSSFEQSDLFNKIKKTLFVLIDVTQEDYPKIDSTYYIDFKDYPELLDAMRSDYNNLVEHILDNLCNGDNLDHNFSGKLGKVIQPRPKTGAKGSYIWAFYLKKHVLEDFLNPTKLKIKKINV